MPSARYAVERLVGRGGMGSVYRGVDRESGEPVALKLVRRAGSDDEDSVLREAGLLARVTHVNVMALHGVDAAEDGTWLVCEWIDGRTLAEMHTKMGPVSAACCALQIVEAIAALHGAGVVHRDIKPANLMLKADGTLKLIDFGVAFHPSVGRGDTVAGSPRYMDPRILGGGGADVRSDAYGAGLVLAELILGEPVWPEMAPLLLHQMLRREGMARLRRALAFAHPELRALVEAAVAPCVSPEAVASGPSLADLGARLKTLLTNWGVRDPAAYLAAAQREGAFRDEGMAKALKAEAQAKVGDAGMKAKDRAPWFGYAGALGVSPAEPRRRRVPVWGWAVVAGLSALGAHFTWKMATREKVAASAPAVEDIPLAPVVLGPPRSVQMEWDPDRADPATSGLVRRSAEREGGSAPADSSPSSRVSANQATSGLVRRSAEREGGSAPADSSPSSRPSANPSTTGLVRRSAEREGGTADTTTASHQSTDLAKARQAAPQQDPARAATKARTKSALTKVYLSADAWADVFIDGASVGRIPRAKPFELAPGPHKVRLASPLIETLSTTLTVPSAAEARITLSPRKRSL